MTSYSERLWPTPWIFIATLLLLPAIALALTPLNLTVAIVSAILSYLLVAAVMLISAPTISIVDGTLTAGRAQIPVSFLGDVDQLQRDQLTLAIGPKLDARAHLLIRGWIHSGVRVAITDPADPAPYWVLTTRNPARLSAAIESARSAAKKRD